MTQTYKILLSNVGYCTGINGSKFSYLLHGYRYLFRPKKIEDRVLQNLSQIIEKEKPNLCCLIEIEKKHSKILQAVFSNKYGEKSILKKIPGFAKNGNGFLADSPYKYKKHYFKNGTKKLIYEIKLDSETSVFMAHFSLKKKTRVKQFEEISQLIKDVPKVIVCGDFNIFNGLQELKPLLKNENLKVINTDNDKTFPAYNPTKIFDIFLTSKNIQTKNLKILNDQFSDHLALSLEFELS